MSRASASSPMRPFEGPKYHENARRGRGGDPCVYCGRPIKDTRKAVAIGVTDGGNRFYNVKDDQTEQQKDPAGCMGAHLLGPDCARKLKAQQQELFL